MTSEKLQVKCGDLHMTVKMASNRFLRAELSAQEKKKRTCQMEGSGVLNHWSLRILKHLPEWEPKLLLEDFNFPDWGRNYHSILLCGAEIHPDLIHVHNDVASNTQLVVSKLAIRRRMERIPGNAFNLATLSLSLSLGWQLLRIKQFELVLVLLRGQKKKSI